MDRNTKQNYYEVERILDKRRNNLDELEYLVKWKILPDDESSWEPFQNVKKAYSKVFEYEFAKKAENNNYEIDKEIYILYEQIRFNILNRKEKLTDREPLEIVKIFKRNEVLIVQIKWQSNQLNGTEYPDSYVKYTDCLRMKKIIPLLINKLNKYQFLEE